MRGIAMACVILGLSACTPPQHRGAQQETAPAQGPGVTVSGEARVGVVFGG